MRPKDKSSWMESNLSSNSKAANVFAQNVKWDTVNVTTTETCVAGHADARNAETFETNQEGF
jgi:hypothetical protein